MTIVTRTPLVEARRHQAEANPEEALRWAIFACDKGPDDPFGPATIADLAITLGRPLVAAEAARALVAAFCHRGDLPAAVFCASLVTRAGEDASASYAQIAEVFYEGSKRIGKTERQSPPPLPKEHRLPVALRNLKGEALYDRADRALTGALAANDARNAGGPVPAWPLFSALGREALEAFLKNLDLCQHGPGASIITEGDVGDAAFVVVYGALRVHRSSSDALLAELGAGAILGEMALVSRAPRAASVTTSDPTALLRIPREALEALAEKTPRVAQQLAAFCRERMLGNLVEHSPILRRLSPSERTAVLTRFELCSFEVGEVLIHQGREGDSLFLIASGGVEAVQKDAGEKTRVAALGPGHVVGEVSLVLRRPAGANVVASHPTVALRLKRGAFEEVVRDHPGLLAELYATATGRDDEIQTVIAQQALSADDVVLL